LADSHSIVPALLSPDGFLPLFADAPRLRRRQINSPTINVMQQNTNAPADAITGINQSFEADDLSEMSRSGATADEAVNEPMDVLAFDESTLVDDVDADVIKSDSEDRVCCDVEPPESNVIDEKLGASGEELVGNVATELLDVVLIEAVKVTPVMTNVDPVDIVAPVGIVL
jgi:hypothetical protein